MKTTLGRLVAALALTASFTLSAQPALPERKWKYVGVVSLQTLSLGEGAPVISLHRDGSFSFEGADLSANSDLSAVFAPKVREGVKRIAIALEPETSAATLTRILEAATKAGIQDVVLLRRTDKEATEPKRPIPPKRR